MQVIEKAVSILEILSEHDDLTVSEIAEAISLPVPTVYRLLTSLTKPGLLEKDARRKSYRLGWAFLYLGAKALERCNNSYFMPVLHPCLEGLTRRTGETATLAALAGDRVVCLDKVEGTGLVRIISEAGKELPFNASAPGKVVLAWQKPAVRASLLKKKEFVAYTENTIVSKSEFEEELKRVKAQGYGTCIDEMEVGHVALSAPVLSASGQMVVALSLLGPSQRMLERMDQAVAALLGAAEEAARLIRDQHF